MRINKKDKKTNSQKSILNNNEDLKNNRKQVLIQEINEILDGLTEEELAELEAMGDFSKEAIEWIKAKKRKKKFKKKQEDFERSLKVSNEILKKIEMAGKLAGYKNGQYKPQNKAEKNKLDEALKEEQIAERGERIREKEKEMTDRGGRQMEKDRSTR